MENLNNKNINDEKYIPFLQFFNNIDIHNLIRLEIIKKDIYYHIIRTNPIMQEINQPTHYYFNDEETIIDEIISKDDLNNLQRIIREKGINETKSIVTLFIYHKMEIPIIQYCIIKNAIQCFKYLLINGFDPKQIMDDQDPEINCSWGPRSKNQKFKIYEWDCMATAIFFGQIEMIKILEENGIEKGIIPAHLEAAIFSYRNSFVKGIISNHREDSNYLNQAIVAAAKSDNIKAAELLFELNINIETCNDLKI